MQLKRRLVTGALCAAVALGAPLAGVTDAYATGDYSNIKGEASQETKDKIKSAEERYQEAQDKLAEFSLKLEDAQNNLYQIQVDLEETREQIKVTKEEIDQKEKDLAKAQKTLSERISSNYKTGNINLLSVVLEADDFNDFVSRVYYMGKVSDQDAKLIQEVKDIKTVLEEKKQSLVAREEEQVKLEEQLKAETEQAKALVEEQDAYAQSLDDEVKALYEKARQEEEADRDRKIAEAQEAARRAAEQAERERQAAQARKKSGLKPSGGSSVPGKPSTNIVNNALRHLGKPYVWGAEGPNSFDCSGLTMRAYADAGISLPHSSRAQYNIVRSRGHFVTDPNLLVPGDLVFFYSPVSHVGIYVGDGKYVHAPSSGRTICVRPLNLKNFVGGGSV